MKSAGNWIYMKSVGTGFTWRVQVLNLHEECRYWIYMKSAGTGFTFTWRVQVLDLHEECRYWTFTWRVQVLNLHEECRYWIFLRWLSVFKMYGTNVVRRIFFWYKVFLSFWYSSSPGISFFGFSFRSGKFVPVYNIDSSTFYYFDGIAVIIVTCINTASFLSLLLITVLFLLLWFDLTWRDTCVCKTVYYDTSLYDSFHRFYLE